jgi:hypothetical protein
MLEQFNALRQALAQHECSRSHPHENMDSMCELRTENARLTNENARLKKALAQPEQEPVAWENGAEWEALAWHLCAEEYGEEACADLLYDGGPIPMPWGERWLKYEEEAKRTIELVRRYTAPPKRGWVGLTDEEVFLISEYPECCQVSIRNAEAKLKEKNT